MALVEKLSEMLVHVGVVLNALSVSYATAGRADYRRQRVVVEEFSMARAEMRPEVCKQPRCGKDAG